MRHQPAVSILIPTYNYARFLPEAIESVLSQDFSDMEIIVSDDASTDESPQLLRHYCSADPRLRTVQQPRNLGMAANWNWCLENAKGKYVRFLFGDDRLGSRDAIRRQFHALEMNPGVAIAVSARTLIDERSRKIGLWDDLVREGLHSGREVAKQCLIQTRNMIGEPSAVMFRASCASRGFDTRYRQIVDLEFWLHLLSSGDLFHTHASLCDFRCHSRQATESNKKLKLGFSEHAMLLHTHLSRFLPDEERLDPAAMRHVFSTLHYARKARGGVKDADAVVRILSSRLPVSIYVAHWLRFLMTRPCVNLRKFLHKRLTGRRLEWSFGSGWSEEARLPGQPQNRRRCRHVGTGWGAHPTVVHRNS